MTPPPPELPRALKRPAGLAGTGDALTTAGLRMTKLTVDHARDAVFWHRLDGQVLYVNDAACESLGYRRQELLSMSVPDFDPVYDPDRFHDLMTARRRVKSTTFESTHRRKDGTTFPVEISITHHDIDGHDMCCAFVREITERKQTERSLRFT
jgi:PAS domain S-box-containing protein